MAGDKAMEAGAAKRARDVAELECSLVRARDQLRVIIGALEEFSQGEAVNGMGEADASMVFGVIGLLEQIAASCERAFTGAS